MHKTVSAAARSEPLAPTSLCRPRMSAVSAALRPVAQARSRAAVVWVIVESGTGSHLEIGLATRRRPHARAC